MNLEKTIRSGQFLTRGVVVKTTATAKDGMRFYCEDPLLSKWRAEEWRDGVLNVGWGTDMAAARADLIAHRTCSVAL